MGIQFPLVHRLASSPTPMPPPGQQQPHKPVADPCANEEIGLFSNSSNYSKAADISALPLTQSYRRPPKIHLDSGPFALLAAKRTSKVNPTSPISPSSNSHYSTPTNIIDAASPNHPESASVQKSSSAGSAARESDVPSSCKDALDELQDNATVEQGDSSPNMDGKRMENNVLELQPKAPPHEATPASGQSVPHLRNGKDHQSSRNVSGGEGFGASPSHFGKDSAENHDAVVQSPSISDQEYPPKVAQHMEDLQLSHSTSSRKGSNTFVRPSLEQTADALHGPEVVLNLHPAPNEDGPNLKANQPTGDAEHVHDMTSRHDNPFLDPAGSSVPYDDLGSPVVPKSDDTLEVDQAKEDVQPRQRKSSREGSGALVPPPLVPVSFPHSSGDAPSPDHAVGKDKPNVNQSTANVYSGEGSGLPLNPMIQPERSPSLHKDTAALRQILPTKEDRPKVDAEDVKPNVPSKEVSLPIAKSSSEEAAPNSGSIVPTLDSAPNEDRPEGDKPVRDALQSPTITSSVQVSGPLADSPLEEVGDPNHYPNVANRATNENNPMVDRPTGANSQGTHKHGLRHRLKAFKREWLKALASDRSKTSLRLSDVRDNQVFPSPRK
ncbi:hypothetical protein BKA70DRAFT_1290029 [Coprinopsis sp. MPI-PUGE-AT-0042]|nr:hypothetical protein BKA70DRAFT_1290029 [Coprinopsis sp. MPI-PUGE-AT-0042]